MTRSRTTEVKTPQPFDRAKIRSFKRALHTNLDHDALDANVSELRQKYKIPERPSWKEKLDNKD